MAKSPEQPDPTHKKDTVNEYMFRLRIYRLAIFRMFSGCYTSIILKLKGIQHGRRLAFYGIPCFHRYPHSTISIGDGCTFRSDPSSNLIGVNHKCIISTHNEKASIRIGNNCGLSGVTIGAAHEIILGNRVLCGANVVITDFDWHLDISGTDPKPVIIGDNAWIGLNSVVLKGVEIGENSIIGANSLVVSNIPPNVIAGGNPCKVLKTRE